jgi:hypothetical protein
MQALTHVDAEKTSPWILIAVFITPLPNWLKPASLSTI